MGAEIGQRFYLVNFYFQYVIVRKARTVFAQEEVLVAIQVTNNFEKRRFKDRTTLQSYMMI